jgi:hypothetical protein
MLVVSPVHVRHGEPVVKEVEMKFTFLQHATKVAIIVRRSGIASGVGMPPGTGEVRAVLRLQESDRFHLAHGDLPFNFERLQKI